MLLRPCITSVLNTMATFYILIEQELEWVWKESDCQLYVSHKYSHFLGLFS